jgi:hypothetical protein
MSCMGRAQPKQRGAGGCLMSAAKRIGMAPDGMGDVWIVAS